MRARPNLLLPLIDVFMLSLLTVLVHDPQFNRSKLKLPWLTIKESEGATAAPERAAFRAELRGDGSAWWQDEQLPVESLARCVVEQTQPSDRVQLAVETEGGVGPLQAFLQFQAECGKNRVWDRIRVSYESEPPAVDEVKP